MIDLRALEQDPAAFEARLRRRGEVPNLNDVVELAKERKEAIRAAQSLQETRNQLNEAMKKATPEEREHKRAELRELGDRLKVLEAQAKEKEEALQALAMGLPNPPRDDVPVGADEAGNLEVRRVLAPSIVTGIDDDATLPVSFRLDQNYPNPFNPSTTIEFSLLKSSKTTLIVYNMLGQTVTKIVDGDLQAGSYKYNWNASNLSSGIYFYRIVSGDFIETKKMMLIK